MNERVTLGQDNVVLRLDSLGDGSPRVTARRTCPAHGDMLVREGDKDQGLVICCSTALYEFFWQSISAGTCDFGTTSEVEP